MSNLSRTSITAHVRRATLASVLAAVGIAALCSVVLFAREFSRQKTRITSLIQLYSDDSVSIELGRNNLVYVEDSLRRIKSSLGLEQVWITGINGELLASSGLTPAAPEQTPTQINLSVPVQEHSSRMNLGTLNAQVSIWAFSKDFVLDLVLLSVLIFATSLAVALFISNHISRTILNPIRELADGSLAEAAPNSWPTELYDLSEALQDQQGQRDLALLGTFSGGVIHDLRNHLQGVRVAQELVQEAAPGTTERMKFLENLEAVVGAQIHKMMSLIDLTLDGVRDLKPNRAIVPVSELIEDSIQSLHLKDKALTIETVADGNAHQIYADRDLMVRVFSNLVKNASEAVQETKAFRAPHLKIQIYSDEAETLVTVSDSGPGIPTSSLSQTFRRIRSTKVHGTGLGLVVARRIVDAHGGEISVGQSDSLGGAKFTVRLPNREVSQ